MKKIVQMKKNSSNEQKKVQLSKNLVQINKKKFQMYQKIV